MKQKTGQRDSHTALRLAPDVKGLYAEARILRDTVLRRIVAAGDEIDEESLPEAQAIVSSHIGALVAAPEFEIVLDYSPGEARIVTLLVHACAGEIAARAEERRNAPARRRTPLRLVPPDHPPDL
jgi:hypothetical protein